MKQHGGVLTVILALALAAAAGVALLLARVSPPETPPVSLSAPPVSAPPVSPPPEQPGARVLEIAPDTVQTVLALLRRPDSYSRTLTVQRFWSGGSAETIYRVSVLGDSAHISVPDGGTEKHILLRGAEKWIWYADSPDVYHGPAKDGDADGYQSIPSYEEVLALPPEAILEAAYTDYDGQTAVYVRYVSGALGYQTACWISDEHGLLIGAECYDGEVLIYAMRSGPVDRAAPDEALFQPPQAD
ncbi:MAG: hypothetical protein K5990_01075 [Oscillospiraceae bacterium]|nr:hypothetical protein [Oscillospiraceae bacterium]